jgi:hypothetical protein
MRTRIRLAGALGLCSLPLTACGSAHNPVRPAAQTGAHVSAQVALNSLTRTGIPRIIVAISYQIGQAPTMCSVLPQFGHAEAYTLLVAWLPTNPNSNYASIRESVLQATIGSSAKNDRFHVDSFGGQKPEPAAVQASVARVALSNPARCEALANGDLRLVTSN